VAIASLLTLAAVLPADAQAPAAPAKKLVYVNQPPRLICQRLDATGRAGKAGHFRMSLATATGHAAQSQDTLGKRIRHRLLFHCVLLTNYGTEHTDTDVAIYFTQADRRREVVRGLRRPDRADC
jgi:hypothetical protein